MAVNPLEQALSGAVGALPLAAGAARWRRQATRPPQLATQAARTVRQGVIGAVAGRLIGMGAPPRSEGQAPVISGVPGYHRVGPAPVARSTARAGGSPLLLGRALGAFAADDLHPVDPIGAQYLLGAL